MRTQAILFILLTLAPGEVYGQGTFRNLNFESANVSGYAPGTVVPISDALPGWTADFSPSFGQVWCDAESLGGAMISVCDSRALGLYGVGPLQGNFSAFLFGGEFGPASITQTGLVPADAKSLRMAVAATLFNVSLGGVAIPMVPLANHSTYVEYGGDISAFAGQVLTLRLTAPTPPPPQIPPSFFMVDDVTFSPEPIPEPATVSLLALGVLLIGVALGSPFSESFGQSAGHHGNLDTSKTGQFFAGLLPCR